MFVGVGALVYLTLAWMPSVGGYVQWVPKLVPVNIKVAPVKNSNTSKQKLYQQIKVVPVTWISLQSAALFVEMDTAEPHEE